MYAGEAHLSLEDALILTDRVTDGVAPICPTGDHDEEQTLAFSTNLSAFWCCAMKDPTRLDCVNLVQVVWGQWVPW